VSTSHIGITISRSQGVQEWLESTRFLQIHGSNFEDILHDVQHESTDSYIRSVPNQDDCIQDSFYGRFFDTVERMSLRLMTSRNGRIGMVPQKAMKGDLVCILFGCSLPVYYGEASIMIISLL
jgi:hypothetical protein